MIHKVVWASYDRDKAERNAEKVTDEGFISWDWQLNDPGAIYFWTSYYMRCPYSLSCLDSGVLLLEAQMILTNAGLLIFSGQVT